MLISFGLNEDGQCGSKRRTSEMETYEKKGSPQSPMSPVRRKMLSTLAKQGAVPSPLQFPNRIRIKRVAAGSRHSMALTDDGQIFTWGWGLLGQLGLGHNRTIFHPTVVEGLPAPAVDLSAGGMHSAIVDRNGECYTWGSAQYGQLGQGDAAVQESYRCRPEKVFPAAGEATFVVKSVACGGMHTAAVDEDGNVYCWGRADAGQTGLKVWLYNFFSGLIIPHKVSNIQEPAASVACGAFHTIVVAQSGKVYAFGKEDFGILGTGNHDSGSVPTLIESISHKTVIGASCGGWHTLLWTDEGELFACGKGEFGRLGTGKEESRIEPTLVDFNADIKVRSASAGGSHSLAIGSDGNVYAFGRSGDGRLGIDNVTGERVVTPASIDRKYIGYPGEVAQVCTGGSHSLVLTTSCVIPEDNEENDEIPPPPPMA
jgi:alpha-tubulin suppressor-like RCC1 family protein